MLLLHLSVELFILDFLSVFVLLFVVFNNFIQLLYKNFRRDLTLVLVLIHAMVCLDLSLQDLKLLIQVWSKVLLRIRYELLHLSDLLFLLLLDNLRLKLLNFLFCIWVHLLMRDLLVLLVDLLLVQNMCDMISFLFLKLSLRQLGTRLLWLSLLVLLILLRLRIVVVICFDYLVLLQDGEVSLGLRGTLLHLLNLFYNLLLVLLLVNVLIVLTDELSVGILQVAHIVLSAFVLRLFISFLLDVVWNIEVEPRFLMTDFLLNIVCNLWSSFRLLLFIRNQRRVLVLIELLVQKFFLVFVSLLHASKLIPIQLDITLVVRLRIRGSLPNNLELCVLRWFLNLRLNWQLKLTIVVLDYLSFIYLAVLQRLLLRSINLGRQSNRVRLIIDMLRLRNSLCLLNNLERLLLMLGSLVQQLLVLHLLMLSLWMLNLLLQHMLVELLLNKLHLILILQLSIRHNNLKIALAIFIDLVIVVLLKLRPND